LKPIRKLNTDLIVEEWENLLRIFDSLALKTTTQSIIVHKLNSYARKNKTCQALWEYDNIISSLYLLDFVDSPLLRKNVQTALNRGESYHQLRRAVSYANFGKLRFTSEDDHEVAISAQKSGMVSVSASSTYNSGNNHGNLPSLEPRLRLRYSSGAISFC